MNFRGKFTELLLCFAIFLAMSVNTATALAESCAVDFGLRFPEPLCL